MVGLVGKSACFTRKRSLVQVQHRAPRGYSSVGRAQRLQRCCHQFKTDYLHLLRGEIGITEGFDPSIPGSSPGGVTQKGK